MTLRCFQTLVSALVTLLVLGMFARAQDRKDPQSAFEPRSSPGAGQKFLQKFVGDWDVTKTFQPRSGAPVQTKGDCRQTMEHGGRFLKSEFSFGQGQTKTTGTGVIGFEADSGKFTSVWTDSRSTRMSLRQSEDPFKGEEIVLFSKSLQAGDKESRRSRTVTRLEEGGRKIVHRQYTASPDGKERLVMELILSRRDSATPAPAK